MINNCEFMLINTEIKIIPKWITNTVFYYACLHTAHNHSKDIAQFYASNRQRRAHCAEYVLTTRFSLIHLRVHALQHVR